MEVDKVDQTRKIERKRKITNKTQEKPKQPRHPKPHNPNPNPAKTPYTTLHYSKGPFGFTPARTNAPNNEVNQAF
jgi:hypothetical protein